MKISRIRDVKLPTRGTIGSAGIDFYVPNDYPQSLCILTENNGMMISSGIKADVPNGYALIAFNKSGIAARKGLIVGACVVDSDYQGEIHLHLINTTNQKQFFHPGQKLVQFLLIKVDHCQIEEVPIESLYDASTDRGTGAFGSTGVE